MSDDVDYETTDAMLRYGGSFVQGLADLYRRADVVNRAKLRHAFAEYFLEYRLMARNASLQQEKPR